MHSLQWYDYLRMCTAALALFAIYRVVSGARGRWDLYASNDKDYLWAFCALLFLQLEVSLESILRDRPWSAATLLSFFITAVCFRASRHRFMEDVVLVHTKGLDSDD